MARSSGRTFAERIAAAPRLGVGISCEFDAGQRAVNIDAVSLRAEHPELVHFLEIGTDVRRGLDAQMQRWVDAGWPCTYHFLDLNLSERQDADAQWLDRTRALIQRLRAAWVCGDAGYWHFARRERGHDILLPPVLCAAAADEMAEAIAAVSERINALILPENPPSAAYVGPMHLLDFYARVIERADCGMLVDCAHLAIFQRARGHDPLDGLEDFPLDRVVELHVAGGRPTQTQGFPWIEDDHCPEPLPETWAIAERLVARCDNLRAVVYECEHNHPNDVLPTFARLNALFGATP